MKSPHLSCEPLSSDLENGQEPPTVVSGPPYATTVQNHRDPWEAQEGNWNWGKLGGTTTTTGGHCVPMGRPGMSKPNKEVSQGQQTPLPCSQQRASLPLPNSWAPYAGTSIGETHRVATHFTHHPMAGTNPHTHILHRNAIFSLF